MNESNTGNNDESKEKDRRIIPLQKAYIWGIIFCAVCLIALVLYNKLQAPSEPISSQIDYLALLRDSHDRLIAMRGVTRIGDRTLEDFESEIATQTGQTLIFPDWIGLLPSVKIIGARTATIGNDKSVSLLFTFNNRNVDFITIYNTKQEITDLETITLEDHPFHKYKWGTFQAYFWEISEDNSPITYGLISDIDQDELQMMTTDTMRSLKNYYQPKG